MNKMLAMGTSVFILLATGNAGAVEAHHPPQDKPAAVDKSKASKPAKPSNSTPAPAAPSAMQMQQMDDMMKQMRDMHDKMMAASTPGERQKWMVEERKLMKDGLALMKNSDSGMACPMMGGKDGGGMMMGASGSGDMMGCGMMGGMAKRMDMMQMMMEMMMDREASNMNMGK
ncbi:hypothetical protein [Chitinivorax sp. B]|uniref:hypothetical protein n=1 Tax=Chitinivorax sp. B TaxID=2502235 RepID=UPI0010F467D7|nr:hypothetical protein [Chitinivorax sp. B]